MELNVEIVESDRDAAAHRRANVVSALHCLWIQLRVIRRRNHALRLIVLQ